MISSRVFEHTVQSTVLFLSSIAPQKAASHRATSTQRINPTHARKHVSKHGGDGGRASVFRSNGKRDNPISVSSTHQVISNRQATSRSNIPVRPSGFWFPKQPLAAMSTVSIARGDGRRTSSKLPRMCINVRARPIGCGVPKRRADLSSFLSTCEITISL